MIDESLVNVINEQINKEFYSAYLYLSMGQYFEKRNLKGFGRWFYIQYKEEIKHAEKLISYLNERGGRVILKSIPEPKLEWNSALEAFSDAYEHERFITNSIEGLLKLAIEKDDFATQNMLNWFIDEQIEEEANTYLIVEKIKLIGENGQMLYMLDKELGARSE
ncbi:MAG: ferritin [Caldisericaceae bacterium]